MYRYIYIYIYAHICYFIVLGIRVSRQSGMISYAGDIEFEGIHHIIGIT